MSFSSCFLILIVEILRTSYNDLVVSSQWWQSWCRIRGQLPTRGRWSWNGLAFFGSIHKWTCARANIAHFQRSPGLELILKCSQQDATREISFLRSCSNIALLLTLMMSNGGDKPTMKGSFKGSFAVCYFI